MLIFNAKKPPAQSKVIVNSCYIKVNLKEKNALDFFLFLSLISYQIIHAELNIFAVKPFLVIHQMLLRLQVIL